MEYAPQLATLVKEIPAGDRWLHELKYDGYRMGCVVERGRVRLLSRRGNDWTAQLPEIAAAIRDVGVEDCMLDGEVAAIGDDGHTSFQLLQNAFGGGRRPPLAYFAFDLLSLEGEDLTSLPLEDRKALLEALLAHSASTVIVFSPHVIGGGATVFHAACKAGLEGVVSKVRDAPYEPGRRPTWVKTKCGQRQEFVICGVVDRKGSGGQEVGALALGVHDRGELVYAGKVGTGYSQEVARTLRRRLRGLEQARPPFATPPRGIGRDVHWVRPALVCEVSFTELTDRGHVRHPSFVALRLDKAPADVVRERAAAL